MPEHPQAAETVTLGVELVSADWKLKTSIGVPAAPTRLMELLPLANSLADNVTAMAVQAVEKQGKKISCQKGCAACCRWLVPISQVEARRLRDLVESLPEARRAQIKDRFAAALRRLDQAGLLDKLRRLEQGPNPNDTKFQVQYFLQGIACPFLEDESCSIYRDRPTSCRELLVTSPAEKCALPTNQEVHMVKLPFRVMSALARFDDANPSGKHIRWVPLVLTLEWSSEHPEDAPLRPAPDLVRDLFQHVAERANARLTMHHTST